MLYEYSLLAKAFRTVMLAVTYIIVVGLIVYTAGEVTRKFVPFAEPKRREEFETDGGVQDEGITEEETDNNSLGFGNFLNKIEINGDWKKQGCKIKSMTITKNKLSIKATCKEGETPKSSVSVSSCNSLALKYNSATKTLKCVRGKGKKNVEEQGVGAE
jgi:hypothetical protein